MKTTELTRKELYDMVWSMPVSKLTQQFALSNDGIKKICKQFEIPMPDGGYWMKLKFNKKVNIPKFNPISGGVGKIVLTLREEGNSVTIDQTPLTIRTKEIENDPNAPLIVSDKITKPDIITIQTQEYWKESKGDAFYGKYKKLRYPIRVGEKHKQRALCFMDALIKLLRYRGHTLGEEHQNTCILIDTIYIDFDLREASKRVPATTTYGTSEYIPTGEFILKIGRYSGEKEWRDGKVKIEKLLARIVAKLEIYAQEEKKQQEASRLWRLESDAEVKRKEEIKKQKEKEVAKFNKLVALSEQYNKSQLIRQYIQAEYQKAIETKTLTTELQEWINWANDKADWYDPTINKPDNILDAKI
ncbi:hypothetical protein [Flavobacterium acetivorans]|uniref:hypothetical protein n=1 Tax=Flavobacterium acetivorans TaxID=2893883 RepID=UPI001E49EF05|nr:hypothetical protein [Flavobacterium sp. F-29]UFH34977.1 hypothetical protein LNP19_12870 [Flavobacterium sp. F-29]